MDNNILQLPAERLFAAELEALQAAESHSVPDGWKLSPQSVLTYLTGGSAGDLPITPKYIGNRRLVEIAVATLLTDRALLLLGVLLLDLLDPLRLNRLQDTLASFNGPDHTHRRPSFRQESLS